MIRSLEIKNFKSIKSKYFPLRNLNVLLGTNGSGKSSFIQTLLLLRQSENLRDGTLKLNGGEHGLVNIGTTKDARYQYSKEDEDVYEIAADIFKQKEGIEQHKINSPLFSNKFQYLSAHRLEPKAIHIASDSNIFDANDIGKYGQYTVHYIDARGHEEVVFDNLLHYASTTTDEATKKEMIDRSLLNQINLWLGEIAPGIKVITKKITFDIVLLEYAFKQPNYGSTNHFKPENVGFGITYALHVITALLKAKQGDLLIIENPESHLHPRGQAELGGLIALAAQNDIQIIIKTHSDHLLNGIRVGIKDHKELKDRTILFHFDKVITNAEQYSEITNIEVDKNGELSEYPKNLLAEWSNQILKLL